MVDRMKNIFNKVFHFRAICRNNKFLFLVNRILPAFRNVNLNNFLWATVNTVAVSVYDGFALFRELLNNSLFHKLNCLINRDNICNCEECRLKNSWSSARKPYFLGNLNTVDSVEINIIFCNISLHLGRKLLIKFLRRPNTVEKECTSRHNILHHIIFSYIRRIMTCNKISLIDKICWSNRRWAETKMRYGYTAWLFRVIEEIALSIHIRIITDNLDRILICADCSVRAETPEFARGCTLRRCVRAFGNIKWKICYVIVDWKSKLCLRLFCIHVVINRNDMSRKCILWA